MKRNAQGFTLLEILVALFIFSILSLILVSTLHNVINIESHTAEKAERLRQLQLALLLLSRDVEQTINRPVFNASGKEEGAFIGDAQTFSLTHIGYANFANAPGKSNLQRVKYTISDQKLLRSVYDVIDSAPTTLPLTRTIHSNIEVGYLEYLDKNGKFHSSWPLQDNKDEPLPRAIRIHLTIPDWGRMSQLYIVNAEVNKTNDNNSETNKTNDNNTEANKTNDKSQSKS